MRSLGRAERTWLTRGDVRLEVLEWRTPRGVADKGTAVIALHGAIGDASGWSAEGEAAVSGRLGARPRTLAALSRRGMGGSDAPATGYAFDDFVDDLVFVSEALAYPRYALLAHSTGVPVAIGAAARRPPGLVALVLGDYGPRYPAFGTNWVAQVERRYSAGELTPAAFSALRQMAAGSREIPLDSLLGSIEVPVLVLTGDQSDVLLTLAHRARYIGGLADVRVVTIPGAGHMLRTDVDPGALHQELGRFLDATDL